MIKQFFLPIDCKLCYWGRMSAVAGASIAAGNFAGSYWLIAPFAAVTGLMVAAKWIVNKYGSPE